MSWRTTPSRDASRRGFFIMERSPISWSPSKTVISDVAMNGVVFIGLYQRLHRCESQKGTCASLCRGFHGDLGSFGTPQTPTRGNSRGFCRETDSGGTDPLPPCRVAVEPGRDASGGQTLAPAGRRGHLKPASRPLLAALKKRGRLAESATDRQDGGSQNGRSATLTSVPATTFL